MLLDVKYDQRSRVIAKSVRLYQENEAFRNELLSMLDHLMRPSTLEVDGKDIPFERFYVVLVEANEAVIPEEFLDKRRRAALINTFSTKRK
ncbi:hypothetical protein ACQ86N_44515 [Puia sp. P3]|uniref:hypothetical protein n=1 Tax=Puia sp. P3 TaxID=3423952 RepID=UPI003D66AF9F